MKFPPQSHFRNCILAVDLGHVVRAHRDAMDVPHSHKVSPKIEYFRRHLDTPNSGVNPSLDAVKFSSLGYGENSAGPCPRHSLAGLNCVSAREAMSYVINRRAVTEVVL